jgi:serine/threonine-protein kinase
MLTGAPPFTGRTSQAVLAAHALEQPVPVPLRRPSVPAPLSALVMRLLEKHAADRPQSAEEVLHALESISASPLTTAGHASRRARVRLVTSIAVLALVGGLLAVFARSKAPSLVDENLLAVAPFDAVSGSVAEYREGLLTILSRSLDGAGPIRTVSPTVVVRRWAGVSDPTSASVLGHRTGAGLVVFGQVVPAGADSVRLTASIYDVRRERPAGEVEVRDDRQRIDRIADTLAVRLLREMGLTRAVGAVRSASLGSTSLPAIKLFLRGEQFYRAGRWDSTEVYARRAVAVDSNFTLALRRVANASWWDREVDIPMLFRAGAQNYGLAPRESLLVTIDSLWGALWEETTPLWPLLRRLDATVRETVHRYPEDPEAWYMLGEMAYHFGDQVSPRRTARAGFEAFAKAIELDSAFGPAYEHIIWLGHLLQEPETAKKYGEAYLHVGAGPKRSASIRAALDVMADAKALSPETAAFLDTAGVQQLWDVVLYCAIAVDSAEAAIAPARAFAKSRNGLDSVNVARQQWALALTLAYRGHIREAVRELRAHPRWRSWGTLTTAAEVLTFGGFPADSAAGWLDSLLQVGSTDATIGLAWWSGRRDTVSLHRFEQLAASRSRSAATGTNDADYWMYEVAAVQPYLALAREDTTRALALFAELPDSLCRYCYWDRLRRVQLLSALKRDRDAAALLDEPLHGHEFATPTQVLWALERGRVNERLGNREKAMESYSFVTAAWHGADPELEPLVSEAKEGLARLSAERK